MNWEPNINLNKAERPSVPGAPGSLFLKTERIRRPETVIRAQHRILSLLPHSATEMVNNASGNEINLIEESEGSHLFFDLTNFTGKSALAAIMYRENGGDLVRQWINDALEIGVEAIARFDGVIISFEGDAIRAVFEGTDNEERSVMAAVEIQKQMKTLKNIATRSLAYEETLESIFLTTERHTDLSSRQEQRSKQLILNAIQEDIRHFAANGIASDKLIVADSLPPENTESFHDAFRIHIAMIEDENGNIVREYQLPSSPNYFDASTLKFPASGIRAIFAKKSVNHDTSHYALRDQMMTITQEGKIGIAKGKHYKTIVSSEVKDKYGNPIRYNFSVTGPAVNAMRDTEKDSIAGGIAVNEELAEILRTKGYFALVPQNKNSFLVEIGDDDAAMNRAELLSHSASKRKTDFSPHTWEKIKKLHEEQITRRAENNINGEFAVINTIYISIPKIAELETTLPLDSLLKVYKSTFQAIHKIVARFGGIVTQPEYATNILITLGIPPTEDDVKNTLQCAVEISEALKELETPGHIGVSRGSVYFGPIGKNSNNADARMTITSIDESVNNAARWSLEAKKRSSYDPMISPVFLNALHDQYETGPFVEARLKGIAGIQSSHSIMQLKRKKKIGRIVGRNQEAEDVIQQMQSLQSHTRYVEIYGPRGAGKSVFIDLLQQKMAGADKQQEILSLDVEAQKGDEEKNLHIWQKIIHPLAEKVLDKNPEVQSLIIEACLWNLQPVIRNIFQSENGGVAFDALKTASPEQIHVIMKIMGTTLFQKALADTDIIITINDLDYGDQGSIEMLQEMSSLSTKNSLTILCTVRKKAARAIFQNIPENNLIQKELQALNEDDLAEIALQGICLDDIQEEYRSNTSSIHVPKFFREALYELSGGNPKQAKDIVAALLKRSPDDENVIFMLKRDEKKDVWIMNPVCNLVTGKEAWIKRIGINARQNIRMKAVLERLGEDERKCVELLRMIPGSFTLADIVSIMEFPDDLFPMDAHPLGTMRDCDAILMLLDRLQIQEQILTSFLDESDTIHYEFIEDWEEHSDIVMEHDHSENNNGNGNGNGHRTAETVQILTRKRATKILATAITATESENVHLAIAMFLDKKITGGQIENDDLFEYQKLAARHFHMTSKRKELKAEQILAAREKAIHYNMLVGKTYTAKVSPHGETFFRNALHHLKEDGVRRKEALFQIGASLLGSGQFDKAQETFLELVHITPPENAGEISRYFNGAALSTHAYEKRLPLLKCTLLFAIMGNNGEYLLKALNNIIDCMREREPLATIKPLIDTERLLLQERFSMNSVMTPETIACVGRTIISIVSDLGSRENIVVRQELLESIHRRIKEFFHDENQVGRLSQECVRTTNEKIAEVLFEKLYHTIAKCMNAYSTEENLETAKTLPDDTHGELSIFEHFAEDSTKRSFYFAQENFEKALEHAQKMHNISEDQSILKITEVNLFHARSLIGCDRIPEAQKLLEENLQWIEMLGMDNYVYANTLIELAYCYCERQDIENAKTLLAKLDLIPEKHKAEMAIRGMVHLSLDEHDEALICYDTAVKFLEETKKFNLVRAVFRFYMKKFIQKLKNSGICLNPDDKTPSHSPESGNGL